MIVTDRIFRALRRQAPRWARAGLLMTAVGTIASVVVLVLLTDPPPDSRSMLVQGLLTILPYGLAGSVLIHQRPDLPFGWLLSAAAAGLAIEVVAVGSTLLSVSSDNYSTLALSGLVFSGLAFVPIAVQGLINVRFPSGRPTGRWGRALDRLLIGGLVLVVLSGALGSRLPPDQLPASAPAGLDRPFTGGTLVGHVADGLLFVAPLVVLLGLVAGLGVVARWWRAGGIERQQLKWRATGVLASLCLFPPAVTEHLNAVVSALDSTVFVATLAVPVLRYRLWAIDVIVRRSAVYAGVTAVLVAGYLLIAAAGAALATETVGASTAAVGVTLAFVPVRNLSQRLVDRLFYGRRDDPYQVLSDVGRRLETVATPGEVLPAVVRAVTDSLHLPYVAIERPGDGAPLAVSGDVTRAASERIERWALTYQGAPVGFLAAAPRRGESAFDERDRQVLADIARQAGAAVRAEALTADLLDSRQRLVRAREEERRRLRRELHDGLGPLVTGLGLNIDAARARLAVVTAGADPDRPAAELKQVEEYLSFAKEASSQVIGDLRTVVHDLRPPALDDLGLAGALEIHVRRLAAGAELQVEIDAAAVADLPAAVEVAAFRTAIEAVTNAVRHSDARHATVRLSAQPGPELVLEVNDDGRSARQWQPGVGLTAMRERAEELGGDLTAGPSSGGGQVRARYPLPRTSPPVPARPGADA